ncbi:MAG: hypothetical protein ACFFBD_17730, partial [Candidatus Hodarchaeota archaeon]
MEEVKNIPVTCMTCQKKEQISVTRKHVENAVGGLFRVAVIHRCTNTEEDQVLVVFLDKNFFVRNQTLAPLSSSPSPSKTDPPQTSLVALTRLVEPDELSKILFKVFIGEPVVVMGNQDAVTVIIQTLALFSPFNPKIILWQNELPLQPLEGPQII